MQKIQMRALHHDDRFAQGNKGISNTGQSNNAQPEAALPKCRTVNEQNRAARERQNSNRWQQNPEHPLGEPRVSRRCYLVVACGRHTGYDRRENGVESLIDLPQTVRGADDRTVDTDGCKAHTWRASNKVAEHEEVQPGNERVNKLINADGSSISDQRARFAKGGYNIRLR